MTLHSTDAAGKHGQNGYFVLETDQMRQVETPTFVICRMQHKLC